MAFWGLQLASLVVLALIFGGLIAWGYAAVGWSRGRPLLPPEPRLPATWHFSECLLCFGLYMVLLMLAQGALLSPALSSAAAPTATLPSAAELKPPIAPELPPQTAREDKPLNKQALGLAITADGIAKALAVAGVLLWMTLLDRRSPERLGLWLTRRDLKVGVVAAAMLLPPVLGLQLALTLVMKYQHPVLEVINQGPGLWLGIAMAVNTVAIAPVAEEFFFRGLFQGWLQRRGGRTDRILHRRPTDDPTWGAGGTDAGDGDALVIEGGAEGVGQLSGDPHSPLLTAADDRSDAMVRGDQVARWPWWPVVVSSALFAVVHLGQGAAPLSLFLLALGLGYLYRQTGRLGAPIIVHMILNGLSTAITFLTAAAGESGLS